jgi:hypothetical protein
MVTLTKRASDVRTTEIDLSQVIYGSSGTVAAIPIISTQGRTIPLLWNNDTDFIAEYGESDPSISQTIQSAKNYFINGTQLWALRVTGTGALYAGLLLYTNSAGTASFMNVEFSDPDTVDPSSFVSGTQKAVAMFYGLQGPGSYIDGVSIGIEAGDIVQPTGLTATSSLTGGSLGTATYTYMVSAMALTGESLASAPLAVTVSSGTTNTITVSWPAVAGAVGYRVYGRVTGSTFGLIDTVGATNYSFTDTGALFPDTDYQPITTAANAYSTNVFTVSVYDNTQPNTGALEAWDCTLTAGVDSAGVQTELAERINPFSSYIQVINNTAALSTVPTIGTVAKTAFTGGNSGAAVTSSQVVTAMQVFKNNQLYPINVVINGGIADPTYGKNIDTLVANRGDCLSLLDTPSTSQKYQAAINYRNLTLNLNSSYSALFCPDLLITDLVNGQQLYTPPSGYVASLCALTDAQANPAYSPAGLNRGIVNVLKQRYEYDDGQATAMFQAQVNYFRTFVGQGIALWEQQTLQADYSALSWISVRRIVCALKVALYKYLLYSLQEQNTDTVRRAIVNGCGEYLDTLVNASAINSYQVVCDSSNNPPAAANAGILVVTVIIVPVIPIHEIQLQVAISKSGVTFSEVLSQVAGSTANA